MNAARTKFRTPSAARNLYVSPWFIMARRYIERNTDRGSICRPTMTCSIQMRRPRRYEAPKLDIDTTMPKSWLLLGGHGPTHFSALR